MNTELSALSVAQDLAASTHLPEISVFQHRDFGGWEYRTNLNVNYIGDAMNDQISSFVIVSGQWQMFRHRDFVEPIGPVLGPGYYPWVNNIGIDNDQISSFKCVAW